MNQDPTHAHGASPEDPEEGEEYVPVDDRIIGRAFRVSGVVILGAAAVFAGMVWWLRRPEPVAPVEPAPLVLAQAQQRAVEAPTLTFTDITEASGIRFRHENGARGEKLLPETMGGGCAVLDFDGDGRQDVLLVGSTWWPDDPRWQDPASTAQAPSSSLALYRNLGEARFEDVTGPAGLDTQLYAMGCAIGDFDGDGDSDLFVTAVGPDRLYRNNGGVFTDVTAQAGVAGEASAWSTSAAFFDADQDGDLDLFVCRYVQWNRELDLRLAFQLTGVGRAYGPPMNFPGTTCVLWRNDGNGSFTNVSAEAGLDVRNPTANVPEAKALALMPIDIDRDGRMDVFVANDTVRNFLFHNLGGGRFEEVGSLQGLAYDPNGAATGAMGVDAAYYRNDEALGIAVANFANEMTSLYVTQGRSDIFADEAIADGIGPASRESLSFGLLFLDVDLDGRLDLLQVNGHLEEEIHRVQPSQHYRQSAQLFWNCGPHGPACFLPVPAAQLGDLARPIVGRGAATGDLDGDGDLDLVLMEVGGPALILRNDQQTGHHWLRVRLIGQAPNPEAIGARVELRVGESRQERLVMPARSYLSQVELPVTFGLGSNPQVDELRVTWPDGTVQTVPVDGVDRELVVRR